MLYSLKKELFLEKFWLDLDNFKELEYKPILDSNNEYYFVYEYVNDICEIDVYGWNNRGYWFEVSGEDRLMLLPYLKYQISNL